MTPWQGLRAGLSWAQHKSIALIFSVYLIDLREILAGWTSGLRAERELKKAERALNPNSAEAGIVLPIFPSKIIQSLLEHLH